MLILLFSRFFSIRQHPALRGVSKRAQSRGQVVFEARKQFGCAQQAREHAAALLLQVRGIESPKSRPMHTASVVLFLSCTFALPLLVFFLFFLSSRFRIYYVSRAVGKAETLYCRFIFRVLIAWLSLLCSLYLGTAITGSARILSRKEPTILQ